MRNFHTSLTLEIQTRHKKRGACLEIEYLETKLWTNEIF